MIGKVNLQSIKPYPSNLRKKVTEQKSSHQNPPLSSSLPICPYKPITFSGNINPVSNYDTISDALNFPTYKQLNSEYLLALPVDEFAKKAISQIFKNDRDFLDRHYLSDFNSYDRYSKLGFIDECLELPSNIKEFLEKTNQRKLAIDYTKFFNDNLKSLEKVAQGQYQYTDLFLDKKIGDKNLVDFWLENLGQKNVPYHDKINVLNKSLVKTYKQGGKIDSLVEKTIEEYFKTILKSNISEKTTKHVLQNSDSDNLSNLKGIFLDVINADDEKQKELFKNLIQNNEIMSQKINNKQIQDLLLLSVIDDISESQNLSATLRKSIFEEITNDKTLLTNSINNVLTIIRKELIISKIKSERELQINALLNSKELQNFDKKLLQKLFTKSKNEHSNKILNDIKLFEKKANSEFVKLIAKEPFTTETNNELVNTSVNMVLSNINNTLISTKYEKKANDIFSKLSVLSEALYMDKNMHKANNVWRELVKYANNEWSRNILPKLIKAKQQDYLLVEKFLNQNLSQDLKNTGIISTVFNSDVISIEEKAFLAKKSNTDEFVSFCKFLSEHVPGNNERKKIINRLMEKDLFSASLFEELKETFISDIRAKDYNALTINNTLKFNNIEKSFCDLVIEQFGRNEKINLFSNIKTKVDYLNNFTDEDLTTAFNNLKTEYIKNKFTDNSHLEIVKYDMSAQIDNLMNKLEVDINGQKVNLFNFVDRYIQNLDNKVNRDNTQINFKLDSLLNELRTNGKRTRETQQLLMILLDHFEKTHPNNKELVNSLRSDTERLFSGVLKGVPNIISASIIAGVSGNWLYMLTAILPVIMSIGNEFQLRGRS